MENGPRRKYMKNNIKFGGLNERENKRLNK